MGRLTPEEHANRVRMVDARAELSRFLAVRGLVDKYDLSYSEVALLLTEEAAAWLRLSTKADAAQ